MKLESIFGEGNASSNETDLLSYSTDASMRFGKAKAVAWPSNAEQIRKLMLLAVQEKLNVVPRGAGTGLAGAAVPDNSIVLDFSRMNNIIEVSVSGNYCIVEPGVVVDALNNVLAPNLYFPVVPSSSRICQIGGVLAANAAGLRAIRFGRAADWVESIEVIDGTGKMYSIKGEPLKDFIGREGTTGIITRAKLKLTKPPGRTTMSYYEFDTASQLAAKAKEIKGKAPVVALEFINSAASSTAGFSGRNVLLAEFEDDSGEINDESEAKLLWEKREGAYSSLAAAGFTIIEDPKIGNDKMPEFLEWLESNNIPAFGHIGFGVIHPMFKEGGADKAREMAEVAFRLGGSMGGEHGYGITKKEFVRGTLADEFRKLKKKYDPQGILNRGKVI